MNILSPVTAWRALPRSVWLLVLARTVNRLGAFTLPFLSVILVTSWGASVVDAGYLLAAFGVATIPSRLVGGWLADRWGTRAAIVTGLLATAGAQVALAAAPSLGFAAVAVVALGLAFEIYEPASQAMVADATDEAQRPVAYGLLAAAMSVAGMAAGLLAALLAGVGLRWLFVVDAATCLGCAALVGRWLTVVRPPPQLRTFAWKDRRLLVMLAVGTVFAVVYLMVGIALPLTVVARGLPAADVGLLLAVAAATVAFGQPLLTAGPVARLDDFAAMAVGYLLLGAGLVSVGLVHDLVPLAAATVLWSLGDLVLIGRATAVVAGIAPAGARGGYLATYGLGWGVAAIVGPLVGTRLLAAGGPVLLWSVLGVVCLGLAAVQPVVRRELSGRTPPANAVRPAPRPARR
jgi:MFS family permease